ncbi:MAG: 4Fe-4S cluster-binding domain-containing protein [Chloroflexi bacterium]|nr:4Fe-4S cluster-binding domain-containing protein [Chloroflexota bacterium]
MNEVYLSIQGEGIRAGTANVFVRFTGCNLLCAQEPGPKSPGGFDCDTEFISGRAMALPDLMEWIQVEAKMCRWVILTGGEPGLQTTAELIEAIHVAGFMVAIETNGSVELPAGLDWITVSPKVAEHCIRQKTADEVKYVRSHGQAIPKTCVSAVHYLISPGFDGIHFDARNYQWCVDLIKQNPNWRLSLQTHKVGSLIR